MYHSITLDRTVNTWSNWHLIPTNRPSVSLPSVNEKMVEVPGRNGAIDMTETLTGAPTYSNRKGSWEFYVMHDQWNSWVEAFNTMASFLHGKRHTVILEDDPNYYYEGRLKMVWNTRRDYSTVVIEYDLDPYKVNVSNGNKTLF